MVEHNSNTVRTVAWSEVFPWLGVVRVFRLAIALRALALAAAALLLTAICWALLGMAFSTDSASTDWLEPFVRCPWEAVTEIVPNQPTLPGVRTPQMQPFLSGWQSHNPILLPWRMLTSPASEGLAETGQPVAAVVCLLLCGLTSVAIWGFFGAAICRIAAVQLAADEQVGLGAALRFACRKWLSYCAAPLLPVGGVLLATIPVAVLGFIMRANAGILLGGLLWPLALVAGVFITLLLVGLLFGWPLMWGTISAEGTDAFDALSRSYAYVFQRPLHYLFYAFVAGLIGWLGWIFVQNFAAGVIWMAYWGAGWGCGTIQLDMILGGGGELNGAGYVGAILIRFFAGCVKLLAVSYLFSYFWSAAAAIYLLLRRDVDATEMDEVFLDADQGEQAAPLPPVTTDEVGAPTTEEV